MCPVRHRGLNFSNHHGIPWKNDPHPETSTKTLSFMSPPAIRNLLSSRANKEIGKIWWKVRKCYFNIRYTDVLMKSWPDKNNLLLKSWFESPLKHMALSRQCHQLSLYDRATYFPKFIALSLMISLNFRVLEVREKYALSYRQTRVQTDSATVSTTIIAIIHKVTFMSRDANRSKTEKLVTWQTSLPHHQRPCSIPNTCAHISFTRE